MHQNDHAIKIMTSVAHLLDMFSALDQRIKGLGMFEVTPEKDLLITFFKQVTFLIIFTAHSFDGVLVFGMDSNLRRIGQEKLGSINVRVVLF